MSWQNKMKLEKYLRGTGNKSCILFAIQFLCIYPILIAHPYKTVPTNQLQSYLEEYIKANTVKTILIGLPLKMNQNNTDVTSVINGYKLKLIQKYPEINVVMYDERFSSLIAKRTMIEGNFKKSDRRKKENVDVIAATIILQDYIRSLEIKDYQKHK